jgi:Fungal cellulose binding domain
MESGGGINWQGGTTCTPGWTCVAQNPYYSQCLQSTAGSSSSSSKAATQPTVVASVPPSVSSAAPVLVSSTTTSSSSLAATSTSAAPSGIASTGRTYKTSITYYGTGDPVGGSCLTNTVACFFYANPGYAAAVSQNLYGVGSGVVSRPLCSSLPSC